MASQLEPPGAGALDITCQGLLHTAIHASPELGKASSRYDHALPASCFRRRSGKQAARYDICTGLKSNRIDSQSSK